MRVRGGGYAGCTLKKPPDVHRIDRVVRALVNDLEYIVRPDDRSRDLNPASAPAVRQRHLSRAEWHLVAGNRHRLEQCAADHALGALVQVSKVEVGLHIFACHFGQRRQIVFIGCVHAVTPGAAGLVAWLAAARIFRINSSSD